MYPAAASLSYSLVGLSANAVKFLEGLFSNLGGEGHNYLVEEESLVDSFLYLDGELGFRI